MLRATAPRDAAVVVAHERGDEPLLVARDLGLDLHQLLVEDVKDRLAGDVGYVVGARGGGAAERAGAELALLVAVEGDALVLEVEQLLRRLAAHDLDRVLVAEVVGALDGVERVRLPRVFRVERRVDAALRRVRVRADGVDLREDRDRRPALGRRERGALPGEAGADHEDVVVGICSVYGRETPRGLRGGAILCGSGRASASALNRRRGDAAW